MSLRDVRELRNHEDVGVFPLEKGDDLFLYRLQLVDGGPARERALALVKVVYGCVCLYGDELEPSLVGGGNRRLAPLVQPAGYRCRGGVRIDDGLGFL